MRICAISDTHGMQHKLNIAECDVLIIAGDICPLRDHTPEFQSNWVKYTFRPWLDDQPAREKIFIAGNHDIVFEIAPGLLPQDFGGVYLRDAEHVFEGVKFYGSPWQPPFCDWAFNAPEEQLALAWQMIPNDVDVLITHGPPYGLRDKTLGGPYGPSEHAGSPSLRYELDERLRPELHVYGHIHPAYGCVQRNGTLFANVSICNEQYKPIHPPLYYELGE